MNIKKTYLTITVILVLAMSAFMTGCGGGSGSSASAGEPADGTYTARSSDYEADESGNGSGYGEVTITIEGGVITACEFSMYELDGTLKDDTYGADLSQENRLKAQKAVQAGSKYAAQLVETGSLDGVDQITGATICYSEFTEAVQNALATAAE